MVGSINPSGVEATSAMAAGAAVVILARSPRHRPSQILLAYSLTWLVWSRPLGFLWAAAIGVFGLAYIAISSSSVRRPHDLVRDLGAVMAVTAANIVGGLVWFNYATQAHGIATDGPSRTLPQPGAERYIAIALRWGGMLWENLGVLGWLDTTLPFLLMLMSAAALAVVLYEPLTSADADVRRRRIATGYLLSIVVGTSLIMLFQGFLWQGRYVMPALAAGYLLLAGVSPLTTSRPMLRVAIASWVIGVLGAMWFYARHVYGIQSGGRYDVPNLSEGAQWFGPLGNYGFVIAAAIAAVSLPTAIVIALRHESVSDDSTTH
jgi:hypothetical protein